MQRASRLRSLWSWLPAFRAVAETEHLPTASEALHVSASSLSRTIRLLEEDVGRPLFDRVGRALVLNDAGAELLVAVRFAMRSIDDALVRLGPGKLVGTVTIHVPAPFAPLYVLPALKTLRAEHTELVPKVTSIPTSDLANALRRGRIDIAVVDSPIAADDLTLLELTEIPHAVCCGPGHPLWDRPRPNSREIASHPFVAPEPLPDGRVPDRWPPANPRRVELFVSHMQVGLDACASGTYLAVLPWPIAERAGLRPLPMRGVSSSTLYVMHRPTLATRGRTEVVVDALRALAAARK